MKESVAIAKEADTKKGFSPTKSDNIVHRVRNEPERQLGSLRGVIDTIRSDGGTPSIDSIATELSSMPAAQRASVLLALQRTHGNRYVQHVVAGIQAKLKVGQPGDVYEQEADRVAEAVMRMLEPQVQRQIEEEEQIQTKPLAEQITPLVQRQVKEDEEKKKEEEEEEEELIMAKELPGQTSEARPNPEARINAIRGGGQPIPASTRALHSLETEANIAAEKVATEGTFSVHGKADSNLLQLSPDPSPTPLDDINDILRRNRGRFRFLQQLPSRASAYPGRLQACQDGALYYNPGEASEGRTQVLAEAQRRVLNGKHFYTEYQHYTIVIFIGPRALSGSTDDFLAPLYHEFVHLQQEQRIRAIRLRIVQSNRENLDRITGLSGAWNRLVGDYNRFFDAIQSIGAMERTVATETIRVTGVDLMSHANKEVLAHTQAFARFFHVSIDAAMNQLRQLASPIPQVGRTLGWSYDNADDAARAQAINNVVGVLRTPQDVAAFNTQVMPDLQATVSRLRTPTQFLADLRRALAARTRAPAPATP